MSKANVTESQRGTSNKNAVVMRKVAEEILFVEFNEDDTLNNIMNKFYSIMRKHRIKQGTVTECGRGVHVCNYEWTMAKELFLNQVYYKIDWMDFDNVPLDLAS